MVRRVRGALAVALRHWWLVALLTLLVAAGSFAQYAGTAQHGSYIATRSLRIVVVPEGESSAYSDYAASRQEDEIARMLASGGLLSSTRLDEAIATRMRADHPNVSPPAARDIAAALSAIHTGNLVTLTAKGRTSAEADALATAATETLSAAAGGAMVSSIPTLSAGEERLLVQPEGRASQPTRDTMQQAAVSQVVTRVALALVAGVLLTLLLGWWVSSRSGAPRIA